MSCDALTSILPDTELTFIGSVKVSFDSPRWVAVSVARKFLAQDREHAPNRWRRIGWYNKHSRKLIGIIARVFRLDKQSAGPLYIHRKAALRYRERNLKLPISSSPLALMELNPLAGMLLQNGKERKIKAKERLSKVTRNSDLGRELSTHSTSGRLTQRRRLQETYVVHGPKTKLRLDCLSSGTCFTLLN
jgi:hypothetical protein